MIDYGAKRVPELAQGGSILLRLIFITNDLI
jgi:hypothetical protein